MGLRVYPKRDERRNIMLFLKYKNDLSFFYYVEFLSVRMNIHNDISGQFLWKKTQVKNEYNLGG